MSLKKALLPFELTLWVTALFFFPIYLFRSGLPQISTYIFSILILWVFSQSHLRNSVTQLIKEPPLKYFSLFVLTTYLINGYWYFMHKEFYVFKFSVHYTYLLLVCLVTFNLYSKHRRALIKLTAISAFVCLVPTLFEFGFGFDKLRFKGLFNNPNQLGYWCLLIVAFLSLFKSLFKNYFGNYLFPIVATFMFIGALSLSRVVMAGMLMYLLYWLWVFRSNFFLISLSIIALLIFHFLFNDKNLIQYFEYSYFRFFKENGVEDTLVGRGYQRLFKYPEFLILGAGEGVNYRFGERHEIHSSFGAIVFCYGISGISFLTASIYKFLSPLNWREIILLTPIFLVSIYHFGIRSIFFWIILCFIYLRKNHISLNEQP